MTASGELQIALRRGDGNFPTVLNQLLIDPTTSQMRVTGAFQVSGSKNALVADPDDETRAWQYGADESSTPGRLCHPYDVQVNGGTATVKIHGHLRRCSGRLRVRGPWPQGHPGTAYGTVDGGLLTVTGDDGPYYVEVVGVRTDPAVEGWTHAAEIDPTDAH